MISILCILSGTISVVKLFHDYKQRCLFNDRINNFDDKTANNNFIYTGTITKRQECISDTHDIPIDISLNMPIVDSTFADFSIYVAKPLYINNTHISYNIHDPYHSMYIHTVHPRHYYWSLCKYYKYISSGLQFDNIPLFIDNQCQINYTHYIVNHLSHSKYIHQNYIPSNTKLSLLGKKYDSHFEAECIGSSDHVIKYIGKKYYGIDNTHTIKYCMVVAISIYMLLTR